MESMCVNGVSFGFVAIAAGIIITVFWMVCAWRAMRAHEKLAESVQELCRKQSASDNP